MGSPTVPSDLSLNDPKGQIQRHSDFNALYLVTEPTYIVGHACM